MSEYFVTKREKCEACTKGFINLTDEQKALVEAGASTIPVNVAPNAPFPNYRCLACEGRGYTESSTPLLEVLAKVRFDVIGHSPGSSVGMFDLSMGSVRIEE